MCIRLKHLISFPEQGRQPVVHTQMIKLIKTNCPKPTSLHIKMLKKLCYTTCIGYIKILFNSLKEVKKTEPSENMNLIQTCNERFAACETSELGSNWENHHGPIKDFKCGAKSLLRKHIRDQQPRFYCITKTGQMIVLKKDEGK